MPEPMELVKEAFLKTIKSHVTALSSDMAAGFVQTPPPDGMDLSCDGGGGTDAKSGDSENTTLTVSAQSRRKTRKPNKTSKVVNDGTLTSAGRSSTDGELEVSPELKLVAEEKTQEVEKEASPNKRQSQESTPEKENHAGESAKKRRSNRRSNDSVANQSDEVPPAAIKEIESPVVVAAVVPEKETNGDEVPSQNGQGEEKPPDMMSVDPDTSFEDVENKLTEMFAGIADTKEEGVDEGKKSEMVDPPPPPPTLPTTPPNTTKRKATPGRRNSICLSMLISDKDIEESADEDFALAPLKSSANKKKQRKAPKKGASNGTGGASASSTPGNSKKKGGKAAAGANSKKTKKKPTKWDDDVTPTTTTSKKSSRDPEESRYRGPLFQVRQDGSLGVLNGPQSLAEDDQDARSGAKAKKFLHNGADRNKVIRGLHASTLSMKYDTDRTDTTWICVFCKLGPHKMGLGDLFGPYMATTDCDDYRLMEAHAGDLFKSNRSRLDMVQMTPHRLPVVPAMGSAAAAALAALKSPNSKMVNISVELKSEIAVGG